MPLKVQGDTKLNEKTPLSTEGQVPFRLSTMEIKRKKHTFQLGSWESGNHGADDVRSESWRKGRIQISQ